MRPLITTVTLNAAIDKTYYLARFPHGQVSRVQSMYAEPGGKGINVARVAQLLGCPVVATGFLGGSNGEWIRRGLDRQGIQHDFVGVEGESRLCLNMIDEATGESTEVLEQGPVITADEMAELNRTVYRLSQQSGIVCFSGSLPRGVPNDYYAKLVELVKEAGGLAFVDTSGAALQNAVLASPYFIKPNEEEAAQLWGTAWDDVASSAKQMTGLHAMGIETVSISLGEAGCYASHAGAGYRVHAPKLLAVNTVGCGDAYVAGMAVATARQQPIEECLALATAAGSANALSSKAGYVNPHDVEQLLRQVVVERD